jgi:membrane protein YdbS with pleckstrin-like domain
MVLEERGIEIRQSRLSYFYSYSLAVLIFVFLSLARQQFGVAFALPARDIAELSKTIFVSLFVAMAGFLVMEPEIRRFLCRYVITNTEVIKAEGIIRKKKTVIPYQSVANVGVYKGIIGRILNFGDINVIGFDVHIKIRGVRHPEVLYRIINNKIAMMRGAKTVVATVDDTSGMEKKMVTDWRKEQKALGKKVKHSIPDEKHDEENIGIKLFGFLKKSMETGTGETEELEEMETEPDKDSEYDTEEPEQTGQEESTEDDIEIEESKKTRKKSKLKKRTKGGQKKK